MALSQLGEAVRVVVVPPSPLHHLIPAHISVPPFLVSMRLPLHLVGGNGPSYGRNLSCTCIGRLSPLLGRAGRVRRASKTAIHLLYMTRTPHL